MSKAIVVMLFGLAALFFVGYLHEQVHVTIFDHYGIDSEVNYISSFPNFETVPEEPCPNNDCWLAHQINEAVTYPLLPMFAFFIIATGAVLTALWILDLRNKIIIKELKKLNEIVRESD